MNNQRLLGIVVMLAGFFIVGYFGYKYIDYSKAASESRYGSMRRSYNSAAQQNAVYAGLGAAILVIGGILIVAGKKNIGQIQVLGKKRICEQCKAVAHNDDKYCRECGAPLPSPVTIPRESSKSVNHLKPALLIIGGIIIGMGGFSLLSTWGMEMQRPNQSGAGQTGALISLLLLVAGIIMIVYSIKIFRRIRMSAPQHSQTDNEGR